MRRALFITVAALLLITPLLPYGLIARTPRKHADALVILSGSATYIERAEWAARLWHEGRAPRIILTYDGQRAGWDERRQRNPSFSEREADVLQAHGVPADRIDFIPTFVANTRQEAAQVLTHAQTHNLRSLLFVTSAYHTRRAGWVVRRVFDGYGIETGMFLMWGIEDENRDDIALTVEHVKKANPDLVLTTVSYPIKGTEYYNRMAEQNVVVNNLPWEKSNDRHYKIRQRHSPRYYDFVNRWMYGELKLARLQENGNWMKRVWAKMNSQMGRLGMALTAHEKEA